MESLNAQTTRDRNILERERERERERESGTHTRTHTLIDKIMGEQDRIKVEEMEKLIGNIWGGENDQT